MEYAAFSNGVKQDQAGAKVAGSSKKMPPFFYCAGPGATSNVGRGNAADRVVAVTYDAEL